ncbi:MAG: mechanosensitive ion channel [Gammaproteobacteria bacterium]
MTRYGLCCALVLLVLLPTLFKPAYPADEPPLDSQAPVSAAKLNARLEEIESSSDLDEKTRAALAELVRRAQANLEAVKANTKRTEEYVGIIQSAPEETRTIREELDKAADDAGAPSIEATESSSFEDIERELLQEKANQVAVRAKLDDLEERLEGQTDRPTEIRQRLIAAKKELDDLVAEQKLQVSTDELPWLTEARQWAQSTGNAALRSEIKMLDQELLSHPVRSALLEAKVEQTSRKLKRIGIRVNRLEMLASRQGRAAVKQAQDRAEEAASDARDKHPLVRKLAQSNLELGRQLSARVLKLRKITAGDDEIDAEAKRIEESFRAARERLEFAGMSDVLGEVLREQKKTLAELRTLRKEAKRRERDTARVALRQIRENDEYKELQDADAYIRELAAGLPDAEVEKIYADLSNLVEIRKSLLDSATTADRTYLRAAAELEAAYQRLYNATQEFRQFLDENLLWIRSAPLPGMQDLKVIPAQLAALLSPTGWQSVLRILFTRLTESPVFILVLGIFGALVWKARQLYALVKLMGHKVGKPSLDEFSFTLRALGASVLLALPWPLLLWILGWELGSAPAATDFPGIVSEALLQVAPVFFYIQFFSVMCLPGGVAEQHFGWAGELTRELRRKFRYLKVAFLPLAVAIIIVANLDQSNLGFGLLRLGLVAAMLVLAVFFYRLSRLLVLQLAGIRRSVRYLWAALTVAMPLLLAGLALVGYFYTAGILAQSLVATLWLVFALVVLHQLVVRWLLLAQRRLALQAIRERMQLAREPGPAEKDDEASVADYEEPEIDLFALSMESRKLLNILLSIIGIVGLWLLWSEVMPAFGVLDEVVLWHHMSISAGSEKILPVTLADIGRAVLIAVVTIVAALRLPALLEIVLLQRFNLTSGSRYTATTLTTYTIVGIGIVLFFNAVGGNWSQIQWIFAALSVGIGFGLQEIVANFISGLIILFEQPVRVGDVVTVGDTTGVVTRIRIRATTIRNWDRQELLVPNKEFITNQLLNWSLSDQTTRIQVPVGVAYGSDVQKAMALMDEAARENGNVLIDPAPSIIFEAFGDNTLNLVLRCFVGEQDIRLTTITQLHEAINRKFTDAGITIAFPQRDVHLDSVRPLEVRLRKDEGG